jgi:hypothetical protein
MWTKSFFCQQSNSAALFYPFINVVIKNPVCNYVSSDYICKCDDYTSTEELGKNHEWKNRTNEGVARFPKILSFYWKYLVDCILLSNLAHYGTYGTSKKNRV